MKIPKFAQSIKSYRETGEFPNPGKRTEFTDEDAQRNLDNSMGAIDHWKELDEGPLDLAKGKPGEVLLAGRHSGEYTEAQFNGNSRDGELMVHFNRPSERYGATTATYSKFDHDSVDTVTAFNNNGYVSNSHSHIDYRLASSGPTDLSGSEPVTVTLTPQAEDGYWVRDSQ